MTKPIMSRLAVGLLALAAAAPSMADEAKATFAGGCFWCMEPPYDKLDGVKSTISGYSGGDLVDPSYQQVASGRTDHTEVVQVTYDPDTVDYSTLLSIYWRNIDPVDGGGQFCDRGSQYRPAIFFHNERQKRLAEKTKQRLVASKRFEKPIAVTIEPMEGFYAAKDYHQNYYQENSIRYNYYRNRCGRDARLEAIWGDQAGGKG